jgi:drug/metabolite transporter (DMT)-like permease
MILLACAGYASSGIVLRYKFAGTRPESVMFSAMALATLLLLPFAIVAGADATPDAGSLSATLLLGIGPTGLAFWGFAVLNSRVGPARASIVAYVAPVFAVALGVVFLGESVGPGTLAGLVLILGGSRLATGSR